MRNYIFVIVVFILFSITIYLSISFIQKTFNTKEKQTVEYVQKRIEKRRKEEIDTLFGNFDDIDSVYIIGIKNKRKLEVWIKNKENDKFKKVKSYKFSGFSGSEGPKLIEGDGQIPEGIYGIEYLNPKSKYYLSIKLSYPNDFDKEMGKNDNRPNLGGDIFIHGKYLTSGCIPIGDKNIEELFYLISKINVEKVKVILSPVDFRIDEKLKGPLPYQWVDKLYSEIKHEMNKICK